MRAVAEARARPGQPRADGRSPGRGRHRDLARDAADRQHRGMGAARAADLHLDAGGTEATSTPSRTRSGRSSTRRRLWDATCAVVTSQIQRAIVLRTAAGVIAGLLKNAWAAASTRLESARRAARDLSHGRSCRPARPSAARGAGAAAPRRAQRAAAEHAGRRLRLGPRSRRRHRAARRERRRRAGARRAQRWHAAAQPGARAGPAPARRAAAPPAVGSVADRTQLARRQSPRTAPRRPGRQRQRAGRPAGDRARHPAVRIAARRLAAAGRLQAA